MRVILCFVDAFVYETLKSLFLTFQNESKRINKELKRGVHN